MMSKSEDAAKRRAAESWVARREKMIERNPPSTYAFLAYCYGWEAARRYAKKNGET